MKNAKAYVFPDTEGLDKDYEQAGEPEIISKDPGCGNSRFTFVFVDTSAGQEHHVSFKTARACVCGGEGLRHRQTDRQTDGQTDRWADKHRQSDRVSSD